MLVDVDRLDRPNVVLINCDDLGYGDLGCYGSRSNKTPTIDRLAEEGLRFDHFYMASPVCSASRAALLTGCYPPRIGFGDLEGRSVLFPGQPVGLAPSEVTIARVLSDAGYRTHMVGKWHCGDQPDFLPTRHGFDHYFGLPYSNDMGRQAIPPDLREQVEAHASLLPAGTSVDDVLAHLNDQPPLPLMLDDSVLEQQPDQASLTARYVNDAVRFLREAADSRFFLYLAHLYVHLPIYVQPRFLEQSDNGAYGAAVESVDWATAVLLRELDALGVAENTIVIFTSDNGSRGVDGGSNLPLRGAKGTTWEGGLRVPAIVRWPEKIASGRVSNALVTAMDLLPTLANICGASVPDDRTIDGRDISALWFDETARSPHEAFFYYFMDDLEAVRCGSWKLHLSKHGEAVTELYDLEHDAAESTNLYGHRPDVVADLERHADRARISLGDARLGIAGDDRRAVGRVEHPKPLTTFDPEHPYYMAEYDLSDRG
jgi:arylsulfatase A-like enzyme